MTADLTKPLSLQRRLLLISKHHGNTIQYIRVLYHYRAMRIDPPLRMDPPSISAADREGGSPLSSETQTAFIEAAG